MDSDFYDTGETGFFFLTGAPTFWWYFQILLDPFLTAKKTSLTAHSIL